MPARFSALLPLHDEYSLMIAYDFGVFGQPPSSRSTCIATI